ncbi:hypothetical protein D9M71_412530 [compost metagenome]
MVETFAARRLLDVAELGRAVFQHHAVLQALDHVLVDLAAHTHGVFAVHLVGRVHQAVGQFAVGGEQQQAGGVDVQAADVDPAAGAQARQAVEHGRAAFRIVAGADLAFRLVVDQHAAHAFLAGVAADQVVVDGDGVMAVDALAEAGDGAVDLDPAFLDPGFHVAARAHAKARENLLQFLAGGGWGMFLVFVRVGHLGTSRCVMQRKKGRASYALARDYAPLVIGKA